MSAGFQGQEAVQRAPLDLQAPEAGTPPAADWLLDRLLAYVDGRGLELYPAQEEAILAVTQGENVILNTPTGSGKSLVGLAACFCALMNDERAFYTAPIKALVSEKFLELARAFGPHNVGMMTGDATVNHDAPIICCTAEILSNLALREGQRADLEWVVMDEFHYYSDRDRGVAWQVPLLTLPQARFLLMSATLGETQLFEEELERLTGRPVNVVRSAERPVPLDFSYVETPLHETVLELMQEGKAPVYIVHFSQRAAVEQAQRLTSMDFLSKEQKTALREELRGVRFSSPFGRVLARFIPHGIGVHHAGMLPRYRLLVEKLAQKGLLKVICGTDTLGVGVNIPLRTVLFTQLCKYDGNTTKILSVRDFHQISGRAGRRGFDDRGSVVVQAPEHVIENLQMRRKAEGDAKKLRKLHPKKPPERGYAPWDAQTLERLRTSAPETLSSRFSISHGMLLSVLCRPSENGCVAMKRLIAECHDEQRLKARHRKTAFALFRALLEADIVELTPDGVRVHADLQEDFSLNQALSLFAVQAIESLDPESRDYTLSVLTAVEATLEDPGAVLARQVDKLRAQKLAELKHQGVEYDERVEILAKISPPAPDREILEASFDEFCRHHPWSLGHRIYPKSVARDMYEQGLSFNGYVREYGLERAEGVLLRYLSETYRALVRTVPDQAKTEEVLDLIAWLGAELEQADASLLEEWRRLADPEAALGADVEKPEEEPDITRDARAFLVLVRNALWSVLRALARKDYGSAARLIEAAGGGREWSAESLAVGLEPFFQEYGEMRTDPSARSPKHVVVEKLDGSWLVRQLIVDPEEDLSWSLLFRVDLDACREAGQVVLRLVGLEDGSQGGSSP